MPERTCKTTHEYAGRQVDVGQRFHVEPADVDLMVAMGRIEKEEGDKVPDHVAHSQAAAWPQYENRAMSTKTRRGASYRTKAL